MSMTKAKEKVGLVTSRVDENRFSKITMEPEKVEFKGVYKSDLANILKNQFGVKKEDIKVREDMTLYVGIEIDEILITFIFE